MNFARAVWWLALAAVWLPVWLRLRRAWSADLEQAHGWAVPLLALYLAWLRLADQPEQRPGPPLWPARLSLAGGLLLLAATVPLLEASPGWPLVQILANGAAALVTLGLLARLGGNAWARHFAFPVLFTFTAVSWPSMLQVALVERLIFANVRIAADCVSACGHPAVVSGRLVEVSSGLIGVDEACSGLRSFQAVWMVAWFLGEFFRLRWGVRLALVAASLVTAFLGNVGRTAFLTWRAAVEGVSAVERWHDASGYAALGGTLALVAALAVWCARRPGPPPVAAAVSRPAWPRRTAWLVVVAVALIEALTQGWYGWHERRERPAPVRLSLQAADASWMPQAVPARSRDLLGYSTASGLAWREPAGAARGLAFVFRWEDDSLRAEVGANMHDPRICLPSVGAHLETESAPVTLTFDGTPVPFRHYRFSANGATEHVFFCLWDMGRGQVHAERSAVTDDLTGFRLANVRAGRRRAAVEQITFVVQGVGGDAAARTWFQGWAPRILRRAD